MSRMAGIWTVGCWLTLTATASAADYVTLKGQVTATPPKEPVMVDVKVDKNVCCKAGPLPDTTMEIHPKSHGLKNVVVYLRPDSTDNAARFPADKIEKSLQAAKPKEHVIDQPKCQFEPRVLAAREGDTLVVKNSATISHNVNYSSDEESFNDTLAPGGEKKLKNALKFQRRPISFQCNIHPWMAGRIRTFDHPYFAITDADGKFEIKKAPVGKWRVVYYHENGYYKGEYLGTPIEIDGKNETQELPVLKFEFKKN